VAFGCRYIIKRDIPAQLLFHDDDNNGEYIVTIPDALFYIMMQLRQRYEAGGAGALENNDVDLLLGNK